MPHNLKNPDGTVNFDAVKKETAFLKGKYAQNAENIKKNLAKEHETSEQGQTQSIDKPKGDIVPPKADEK